MDVARPPLPPRWFRCGGCVKGLTADLVRLPSLLTSPPLLQVNPLAPRPLPSALLEQYQRVLLQEEECQQAIRDIEWEVSEIIRTRTNQV